MSLLVYRDPILEQSTDVLDSPFLKKLKKNEH